jgi:hypothetical protein
MKTWQETITHREGEWLGPIDYSYDWNQYNTFPNNPEYRLKKIEKLKEIEKLFQAGEKIRIYYDPILAGELLEIGMYDGWPFWKPTPAVLLRHWSGSEVHFWYSVGEYEIIEEKKKND